MKTIYFPQRAYLKPLLLTGVVLICAAAPVSAQKAVVTKAVTGTNTDWQGAPGAGPQFTIGVQSRFSPAPTPYSQYQFSPGFKAAGASPSFQVSPKQTNPADATNWAQGRNDYSYTRTGIFNQNITYNWSLTALLSPGKGYIDAIAGHYDPFGYTVGSVGSHLTLTQEMDAGTVFQARTADPLNPDTGLNLFARFGVGSSFLQEDPTTLWGTPPATVSPTLGAAPSGAFDLYQIHVYENGSGSVQADVTPDPTSTIAGFLVASDHTSSQVKSAIESASWTKSADGGLWTLNNNVNLFALTLTNNASGNVGQNLVIGVGGNQIATANAAPEPGSVLFLLTGGTTLIGFIRFARSTRRSATTATLA